MTYILIIIIFFIGFVIGKNWLGANKKKEEIQKLEEEIQILDKKQKYLNAEIAEGELKIADLKYKESNLMKKKDELKNLEEELKNLQENLKNLPFGDKKRLYANLLFRADKIRRDAMNKGIKEVFDISCRLFSTGYVPEAFGGIDFGYNKLKDKYKNYKIGRAHV